MNGADWKCISEGIEYRCFAKAMNSGTMTGKGTAQHRCARAWQSKFGDGFAWWRFAMKRIGITWPSEGKEKQWELRTRRNTR